MKNKTNLLTDKILKYLETLAHKPKLLTELKKINKKYINFEKFIQDYEEFINSELKSVEVSGNSYDDRIFELIISRLEKLNNYKKLSVRIYLEVQKNNKYLFIIYRNFNNYISKHLNSPIEKSIIYILYAFAFNTWIEDDKNLEKTMSSIGKNLNISKKILSRLNLND